MKRTSLTLTLASLFVLLFIWSTPATAQDTTSLGIQFVDCPDQLTVHPNDSAYYRVQAAAVTTTKSCPGIHYYLVSGPGWIDSLTGWWSFYPWLEEPLLPSYEVEIAAFFEGDTALTGERCSFTVNVVGGEQPGYTVRIETVHDQQQGAFVVVSVSLESIDPEYGLGGFDLMIAHDPEILIFQQALEGGLYEGCGWEYFNYMFNPYDLCDGCPSSYVRVRGVAETNNGDIHPNPDCQTTNPGYVGNLPATIFAMEYLVTNDRTKAGEFTPLRFFWYQCTDNTLTGFTGEQLFFSSEVYDFGNNEPINQTEGVEFPTYLGAQEECFPSGTVASVQEGPGNIVFYNGGVELIDNGEIDYKGDININGIHFEIADALMFAHFFVEGLSAFGNHAEPSTEASDVNQDGTPLTVVDFVFLLRVVVGDIVPFAPAPDPSPNTAYFSQDPTNGAVSVQTPDSLGAVLLVFDGEIGDSCLSSQGVSMMQGFDGEKSYVFMYSLENKFISEGDIFSCGNGGHLIEAKAATIDARPVTCAVAEHKLSRYAVRIGTDFGWDGEGLPNHIYARVPVTLERADNNWGFSGFDLLMAYDWNVMRFLRADEGALLQHCGWEYFTYRYVFPDTLTPNTGEALCHVVAIAETNDGADNHPNPDCQTDSPGWYGNLPDTLCYLFFTTIFDSTTVCDFYPVRFYWTECTDNLLSSADGNVVFGSARVFDYGSDVPINQTEGVEYPTFLGAQEECMDIPWVGPISPRSRDVDFYNGGVKFRCVDVIDEIGDINTNDIAYEIADLVMYSFYFLRDTAAFGDHVAASTRASDINGDHVPLTVEDFVLLWRTVVGEREPDDPPPPPSPHAARFAYDTATGVVTLATPDTLGAVLLTFRGEPSSDCDSSNIGVACTYDGEYAHVFMWSFEAGQMVLAGNILTMRGDLELVEARTATYTGAKVNTEIVPPGEGEIVVKIEKKRDAIRGQATTLNINLEKSSMELGGFQMLINYYPEALMVQSVDPGSFLEECGWEYFTYRPCPYESNNDGCTGGFLRIFALAEFIDSVSAHPTCFLPSPYPATLASINFIVYDHVPATGIFLPVRFAWWTGCTDNNFTDPGGFYNMVARNVYDYDGGLLKWSDTHPSFAPNCVDPIIDFRLGNVDFYNGGIGIAPPDTPRCDPGDLNTNGVPYELADVILYLRYFIEGWDVFGSTDSTCVLAASDLNGDGEPLTVEDLINLIIIVIDKVLPHPTSDEPAGTVALFNDRVAHEVQATTADTLGVIWLQFDGDVVPTAGDGFTLDYHFDGSFTRALVQAANNLDMPSGGTLLTYTGEGELVGAEAGTYDGRVINVVYGSPTDVGSGKVDGLPTEFALNNNYPNPFNPSTNIEYAVPRSAHVEIAIFNITGQRVRTLVDADKAAGRYTVVWDGTNEGGGRVASGMYFYRMAAGDYVESRKMILLK